MNPAESMLERAKRAMVPSSKLVVSTDAESSPNLSCTLTRWKIMLDLYRAKPSLKLRAMVEDWDVQRIVRELY